MAGLARSAEVAPPTLGGALIEHLRLVEDRARRQDVAAFKALAEDTIASVSDFNDRAEWERWPVGLAHYLGRGRPSHFCGDVS